jgi:hypothetical protein
MLPPTRSYADCAQLPGRPNVRLSIPKRGGNPNWTRPLSVAVTPAGASAFEHLAALLGLSPEQYKDWTELRERARKNRNNRYIPPELLQAWRLTVDTGPEPSRGQHHNRVPPHMTSD